MAVGSHVRAGFSVFRRGRLIEGSVGEAYKPKEIFGSPNSFASQRIVGEIIVEGFEVTHTKDGINWGGHEEEILQAISRQLDTPRLALLDQAEGYRARKSSATLPATFGSSAVEETMDALDRPEAAATLQADGDPERAVEVPPGDVAPAAPSLSRTLTMQVVRNAKPWKIRLELVREPGAPFYGTSVVREDDQDIITVQLNLEHDLSLLHINEHEQTLQPLLRLLAALALGEKVARDAGVKNVGVVRQNANELLGVLARTTTQVGDAR
jgi:hypothetical protein